MSHVSAIQPRKGYKRGVIHSLTTEGIYIICDVDNNLLLDEAGCTMIETIWYGINFLNLCTQSEQYFLEFHKDNK